MKAKNVIREKQRGGAPEAPLRQQRVKRAFENTARYLNSETNSMSADDGRISSSSLVKFGPRTPENFLPIWGPLKIDGENVLNVQ